jgi:hypothetical protein
LIAGGVSLLTEIIQKDTNMKRTILNAGLLSMGVLILSSFTTSSRPGDLTATKEQKRRIKMVKIVDGQKAELDTVVADNKPFVWQGDTLNARTGRWILDLCPKTLKKWPTR